MPPQSLKVVCCPRTDEAHPTPTPPPTHQHTHPPALRTLARARARSHAHAHDRVRAQNLACARVCACRLGARRAGGRSAPPARARRRTLIVSPALGLVSKGSILSARHPVPSTAPCRMKSVSSLSFCLPLGFLPQISRTALQQQQDPCYFVPGACCVTLSRGTFVPFAGSEPE